MVSSSGSPQLEDRGAVQTIDKLWLLHNSLYLHIVVDSNSLGIQCFIVGMENWEPKMNSDQQKNFYKHVHT